jgi:uncharacterized protein YecE (DUF72 family)
MARFLVGLSSWADPTLVESGFYPPQTRAPGERLSYYSATFPMVELDASYHVMPGRRNISSWIEETPAGFIFDVKAFSLFTGHPAKLVSLPRDFREEASAIPHKTDNLYLSHMPEALADKLWERFAMSIEPLKTAGKLGMVMFQFPPWFHPTSENYDYVVKCKEKLPGFRLAVEFRTGGWLDEQHLEKTIRHLRKNGLCLVCVDEPQGLATSLPPLAEVTGEFAAVRFHGRNKENWEAKDVSVYDKFNYLYNEAELAEWAAKIGLMGERAKEVHIIFTNKHEDYAVRNARQMMKLLEKS